MRDEKPSILWLDSTLSRTEQISCLRAERQRNIARAFELLQAGDWHSVKVLACEIIEDGDDLPTETPRVEVLGERYEAYRLLLIDRMVEGDWISAAWLAEILQYLECTIRGMTSPRQGDERAGRIDWLRKRVRHQRHLMERRRESIVAWLRQPTEESAELAGLET